MCVKIKKDITNDTKDDTTKLVAAKKKMNDSTSTDNKATNKPLVLIYHTHSTESFKIKRIREHIVQGIITKIWSLWVRKWSMYLKMNMV